MVTSSGLELLHRTPAHTLTVTGAVEHLIAKGRYMVPLHLPTSTTPEVEGAPGGSPVHMRNLLNHLRTVALACRAAARTDLFEACATLSTDRKVAKSAYAEVLMKCLSQALGATPIMFRPGVTEISFDEAWLLRLVETAQTGDEDSFSFLLRSRVPGHARRNVAGLINAVASQFHPSA